MCKRKFQCAYLPLLLTLAAISLSSVCFGGLKPRPPQDSGTAPQPQTCEEMFKGKTMNLALSSVNLKYDLSKCSYSIPVLHELMAYHYEIMEPKGSIRYLSTILNRRDDMADQDRQPSIKATFSSSICSQAITKTFEPYEVGNLEVKNIPAFGSHLEKLVMSIKSIKTATNGAQLCWEANLSLNNLADIKVDADSKLDCECSWFSYVKTIIRDDRIGVREVYHGDNITLQEVANTGMTLKRGGNVEYIISDDMPCISPILEQPICAEGRIVEDLQWDAPLLLEIKE